MTRIAVYTFIIDASLEDADLNVAAKILKVDRKKLEDLIQFFVELDIDQLVIKNSEILVNANLKLSEDAIILEKPTLSRFLVLLKVGANSCLPTVRQIKALLGVQDD